MTGGWCAEAAGPRRRPDLQRARERRPPDPGAARPRAPHIDVWVADDGSPDGTGGRRARGHGASIPGRVELLDRGQKGGRGAAVLAAFKKGLADPRGYDVPLRDGRRLLAPPARDPEVPGEARDARHGHRLALRPGRRHLGVGLRAAAALLAGQQVHRARGRHPRARHHQRLPRLPPRGAGGHRLRPHQDQGLRGARRDGLPGLDERLPPGRGAHPLQEPRARRLQAHRRGDLHGAS